MARALCFQLIYHLSPAFVVQHRLIYAKRWVDHAPFEDLLRNVCPGCRVPHHQAPTGCMLSGLEHLASEKMYSSTVVENGQNNKFARNDNTQHDYNVHQL
jgi:hypothetical protein